MINKPKNHISVLLSETLEYLKIRPNAVIVDCTLGLGGHTKAILDSEETIKVIGIDQDLNNLEVAKERLKGYQDRVEFVHCNFEKIAEVVDGADAILFDLGICSTHIDEAERGFSFQKEGPLDMRFDQSKDFTAYDIIKKYSAEELQEMFSKYGEETESKTVAEAIVEARKKEDIKTTTQLNSIIDTAKKFKRPGR